MSLDAARRSWIEDEPKYDQFGTYLHERISRTIRSLGIVAQVTYRTKTIDSLLRKLLTKQHHTYETLPDKVGLRVIVRYQENVKEIINALQPILNCQDIDTKSDKLDPDQLGYRATHLQISLQPTDEQSTTYPAARFVAELQIQTHAQHLWAEMAHDVFYKDQQTTSAQLQRRIYLLAGLVEVADNEFSGIEREVAITPDLHNLQILRALERQYYKLAVDPGNTALSLQIIEHLAPLYGNNPGDWGTRFENLFEEKHDVLQHVFDEQAQRPHERSAFFFQPEVLMIYERLTNDRYALRERWNETFPEQELEKIATVFGFSFD